MSGNGGRNRAGFSSGRFVREVAPEGGAAVGEHPVGQGEDGADEEAGADGNCSSYQSSVTLLRVE
jgi:hypothetical protein